MLLTMLTMQCVGAVLASPSALALLLTMFPEGACVAGPSGSTPSCGRGIAVGLMGGGMLTQGASWPWVESGGRAVTVPPANT
jgi:hypothetical protein